MHRRLIIAGVVFVILIVFGYLFFMNQTPIENESESDEFYFYYDAPIYTAALSDIADELASDETKGLVRLYKAESQHSVEGCPIYNKINRSEIVFAQTEVNPLYHNGDKWGYYLGFADKDASYKIVFLDSSSGELKEKPLFFETKNGEVTLLQGVVC